MKPGVHEWQSADGLVHAKLYLSEPSRCDIVDFMARERRRGHGTAALIELRRQFTVISVYDCGEVGSPRRQFWARMAELGLVDELTDVCQCVVWRRED
jgi:hypothetical protein